MLQTMWGYVKEVPAAIWGVLLLLVALVAYLGKQLIVLPGSYKVANDQRKALDVHVDRINSIINDKNAVVDETNEKLTAASEEFHTKLEAIAVKQEKITKARAEGPAEIANRWSEYAKRKKSGV